MRHEEEDQGAIAHVGHLLAYGLYGSGKSTAALARRHHLNTYTHTKCVLFDASNTNQNPSLHFNTFLQRYAGALALADKILLEGIYKMLGAQYGMAAFRVAHEINAYKNGCVDTPPEYLALYEHELYMAQRTDRCVRSQIIFEQIDEVISSGSFAKAIIIDNAHELNTWDIKTLSALAYEGCAITLFCDPIGEYFEYCGASLSQLVKTFDMKVLYMREQYVACTNAYQSALLTLHNHGELPDPFIKDIDKPYTFSLMHFERMEDECTSIVKAFNDNNNWAVYSVNEGELDYLEAYLVAHGNTYYRTRSFWQKNVCWQFMLILKSILEGNDSLLVESLNCSDAATTEYDVAASAFEGDVFKKLLSGSLTAKKYKNRLVVKLLEDIAPYYRQWFLYVHKRKDKAHIAINGILEWLYQHFDHCRGQEFKILSQCLGDYSGEVRSLVGHVDAVFDKKWKRIQLHDDLPLNEEVDGLWVMGCSDNIHRAFSAFTHSKDIANSLLKTKRCIMLSHTDECFESHEEVDIDMELGVKFREYSV